jgi:hypothetical protein
MQTPLPITNGFLIERWQFKFQTDGTELPANDARNRSLSLLQQQRESVKMIWEPRVANLWMCFEAPYATLEQWRWKPRSKIMGVKKY